MPEPFAPDRELMPRSLRLLRDERRPPSLLQEQQRQQPAEDPSYLLDAVLGVPRGVEGLVRSIYSLVDTLSFDLLWDLDDDYRLLGHSETWVGGITEGLTQFLVPYFGAASWIARGATIGRVAVPGLSKLSKAAQVSAKTQKAARDAFVAAAKLEPQLLSTARSLGRAVTAGAIADFTAFQGHEKRLSNLIQTFPALQNPITDFLQAEGDEDTLVGRLKSSLEGLGLGALVDGLAMVVRGVRRGARARAQGKDAEAAFESAVDEDLVSGAVRSHEDGLRQTSALGGQQSSLDDAAAVGSLDDPVWRDVGGRADLQDVWLGDRVVRLRKAQGQWVDDAGRPWGKTKAEAMANLRRQIQKGPERSERAEIRNTKKPTASRHEGVIGETPFELRRDPGGEWTGKVGDEPVRWRRENVKGFDRPMWVDAETGTVLGRNKEAAIRRTLERQELRDAGRVISETGRTDFEGVGDIQTTDDIDIVSARQLDDIVEQAAKEMEQDLAAVNPRNLDPADLLAAGLERNDLNLARMGRTPAAMARAVSKVISRIRFPKEAAHVSNVELQERALKRLHDMLGTIPKDSKTVPPPPLGIMVDQTLKMGEEFTEQVLAWRVVLTQHLGDMAAHAKAAIEAGGDEGADALARFVQSVDAAGQAYRAVKGGTAIQGRALQANNIPFRSLEATLEMFDINGSRESALDLARKVQAMGTDNPSGLFKLVEHSQTSGILDMVSEFWMNAILSGGRTMTINMLGNAMLAMYRPMERLFGTNIANSDVALRAMLKEYSAMLSHLGQAWRSSWEAAKTGDSFFMPGSRTKLGEVAPGHSNYRRAITPENVSDVVQRAGGGPLDMNSGWASAIRLLGDVINVPGRVLMATDDFFKHLNFRGHAFSRLLDMELDRVGSHNFDLAVHEAERHMDRLIQQNQLLSEDMIFQKHMDRLDPDDFPNEQVRRARAIEMTKAEWQDMSVTRKLALEEGRSGAEEWTLTNRLGGVDDALGIKTGVGAVEDLAMTVRNWTVNPQMHPMARMFWKFLFPFVRTPFRLVQFAGHRTLDPWIGAARRALDALGSGGELAKNVELGRVKNRYLQDLMAPDILRSKGGFSREEMAVAMSRKQEAQGRLRIGFAMSGVALSLAANGKITGRGPKDKEQRQLLALTGWQPYSFKVGDSYIQYQRLDPFATIFGTFADLWDAARYSPNEEQGALEQFFSSLWLAVSNNATQKTFMTGFRNLVDGLLSGEGWQVQRVMQRYASSFIPTAVADVGQFLAGSDPIMREVNTIGEALLNRLPYMGNELDPVRNFMGEPVRRIRSVWSDESNGVTDLFLPLAYREVQDDYVNEQIALLQHGFMPPRRRVGGVDLGSFRNSRGQSAYDRMLELRGEVRVAGKSLRRALRELFRSRRYQAMDPISTLEADSPRIREVRSVISRYHRRAKREMFREFPGVRSEIDRVRRETIRRQSVGVLQRLTPK